MTRKLSKKDPNFIPPDERPVVKIKNTDYQPSRKQLKADLRVPATFEQAIEALYNPVQVKQEEFEES